jgi:hypothetical protein
MALESSGAKSGTGSNTYSQENDNGQRSGCSGAAFRATGSGAYAATGGYPNNWTGPPMMTVNEELRKAKTAFLEELVKDWPRWKREMSDWGAKLSYWLFRLRVCVFAGCL